MIFSLYSFLAICWPNSWSHDLSAEVPIKGLHFVWFPNWKVSTTQYGHRGSLSKCFFFKYRKCMSSIFPCTIMKPDWREFKRKRKNSNKNKAVPFLRGGGDTEPSGILHETLPVVGSPRVAPISWWRSLAINTQNYRLQSRFTHVSNITGPNQKGTVLKS